MQNTAVITRKGKIENLGLCRNANIHQMVTLALEQLAGGRVYGEQIRKLKPSIIDPNQPLPPKFQTSDALVVGHRDGHLDRKAALNGGVLFKTGMEDTDVKSSPFWNLVFHDIFITSDREALGGYLAEQYKVNQSWLAKKSQDEQTLWAYLTIRDRIKTMMHHYGAAKKAFEPSNPDREKIEVRTFECRQETIHIGFVKTFHRNTFLQTIIHKLKMEPVHALIHHFSAMENSKNPIERIAYKGNPRVVVISLQEENSLLLSYLCKILNQKEKTKGGLSNNTWQIWEQTSDKMLMTKRLIVTKERVKPHLRSNEIFEVLGHAFTSYHDTGKITPAAQIGTGVVHSFEKTSLQIGCLG